MTSFSPSLCQFRNGQPSPRGSPVGRCRLEGSSRRENGASYAGGRRRSGESHRLDMRPPDAQFELSAPDHPNATRQTIFQRLEAGTNRTGRVCCSAGPAPRVGLPRPRRRESGRGRLCRPPTSGRVPSVRPGSSTMASGTPSRMSRTGLSGRVSAHHPCPRANRRRFRTTRQSDRVNIERWVEVEPGPDTVGGRWLARPDCPPVAGRPTVERVLVTERAGERPERGDFSPAAGTSGRPRRGDPRPRRSHPR